MGNDSGSIYSAASRKSFPSVGLCFSDFVLGFLVDGSVRVGGGVPIASRAAAFTAEAALNGLGLRILDGIRAYFLRAPGMSMEFISDGAA